MEGVWLLAGVGKAAAEGVAAGAGVELGEAFVSSAREVAPLADTRRTTNPTRVSKRIFLWQFSISEW
jgi:hypothetical protein